MLHTDIVELNDFVPCSQCCVPATLLISVVKEVSLDGEVTRFHPPTVMCDHHGNTLDVIGIDHKWSALHPS